jgi:hypothetical protein
MITLEESPEREVEEDMVAYRLRFEEEEGEQSSQPAGAVDKCLLTSGTSLELPIDEETLEPISHNVQRNPSRDGRCGHSLREVQLEEYEHLDE